MSLEVSSILIMLFITIYVGIINIFSILFRMTGLTKEKSKFQTITLFTAVGFTTSESEIITSDRTRRKIATACMITGNFFSVIIVSLIVNLISSFSITESKEVFIVIGIAFALFVVLMLVLQIPAVKRGLAKIIEFFVLKSFGKDKSENFLTLLDNYGDNAIVEIYINRLPRMLDGVSVAMSGIKQVYNINILTIKRKDHVLNITSDTMVQQNDRMIVFGKYSQIREVFVPKYAKLTDTDKQTTNVIELMDNFSGEAMTKVVVNSVPQIIAGKSLAECRLKALYGINIVILERDKRLVEVNAETQILPKDELILFGPFNNIRYLFGDESRPDAANVIAPPIEHEEGIFAECPSFEGDSLQMRRVSQDDCDDLLEVYSDEASWPFFNKDDCNADNLQYTTIERVRQAVEFWDYGYDNKWSVRWAVVDKSTNKAIGTLEISRHEAKDHFHHGGLIRLDMKSSFEKRKYIEEALILAEKALPLLDCDKAITKCFAESAERTAAMEKLGYEPSDMPFVAYSGNYFGYAVKKLK